MGTHAERVAIKDEVSREDQDAFALARTRRRSPPSTRAGSTPSWRPSPSGTPRAARPQSPSTRARGGTRPPRRWRSWGPRSTCRTARTAARRRSAPSPPATRRGSRTAPRRRSWHRSGPWRRLGLQPLARIVGYAQAEVAPKWLFLAPVQGVRGLEARTGLPIDAYDLIEINEAFAAQALADGRELGFDWSKVNVNGGAIALGHPIGASGARSWRRSSTSSAARAAARARDPVPRRRRLRRDGVRAGLRQASAQGVVGYTRSMTERAVTAPAATGPEIPTHQLFIAGRWVEASAATRSRVSTPPTRATSWGRFQAGTAADVAMAVRAAETAGPARAATPAP